MAEHPAASSSREVESANDRYAVEHPHGDWHIASAASSSREVESANDRYAIEHPHGNWHVAPPDRSAASPSRVALAVKGWRCFLGWHHWNVRNVVGRYISGRGFDGAYEVYQECARCGEERSYMEWNRRVGAKLEEAVRGRSC